MVRFEVGFALASIGDGFCEIEVARATRKEYKYPLVV